MIAAGTESPIRVVLVVTSTSPPGITYWPDHIEDFGPP